jgi:copper chaperone
LEGELSVKTYTVQGMTCGHCVSSVKEEVGEIAGVTHVDVDLATGRLDVSGNGVTDDAVRLAVEEAGYKIVA